MAPGVPAYIILYVYWGVRSVVAWFLLGIAPGAWLRNVVAWISHTERGYGVVRSVVAWFREGAACAANPGEILQNFMEFLKSQAREQVATRGWWGILDSG